MKLADYIKQNNTKGRRIKYKRHTMYIASGFLLKKRKMDFEYGFYHLWAMVYVLRGSGTYTDYKGKKYKVKAGDVFCRDPRYKHSLIVDDAEQWAEVCLGFSNELEGIVVNTELLEESDNTRNAPEHDNYLALFDSFGLLTPDEPVRRIGIKLDLLKEYQLLIERLRTAPDTDIYSLQAQFIDVAVKTWHSETTDLVELHEQQVVKEASNILAEYACSRTPLPELLSSINASFSSIRKLFKKHRHISVGDYRIQKRIDLACNLLMSTDRPLMDIADELGYHDQFVFSRQFKQFVGKSPSQFRKEHRIVVSFYYGHKKPRPLGVVINEWLRLSV